MKDRIYDTTGMTTTLDAVLQFLVHCDMVTYGDIVSDKDNTVQMGVMGDDYIGLVEIGKKGVQNIMFTSKNASPMVYEHMSKIILESKTKITLSIEEKDGTTIITGMPALKN